MGETILLTGAAGLIGRVLHRRLIERGDTVIATDRLEGEGIIACDLTEVHRLHELGAKATAILHCGAISGPMVARDNPHLIVRLNEEKTAAETTRDHAQAGERAKSAFISNISQELRTPLNAILGMAQLLEHRELEKVQRDHVKVLLEAGRGLKTLLDDIIALGNQTDETMVVPIEGCDAAQAAPATAAQQVEHDRFDHVIAGVAGHRGAR